MPDNERLFNEVHRRLMLRTEDPEKLPPKHWLMLVLGKVEDPGEDYLMAAWALFCKNQGSVPSSAEIESLLYKMAQQNVEEEVEELAQDDLPLFYRMWVSW